MKSRLSVRFLSLGEGVPRLFRAGRSGLTFDWGGSCALPPAAAAYDTEMDRERERERESLFSGGVSGHVARDRASHGAYAGLR